MALFDLNRAGDTPISTLKVAEIAPLNWHKYPPRIAGSVPVNVPVVAFNGGAYGDDVDQSTANATDVYTPRTQAAKAAAMVPPLELVVDVGRPRGTIGPKDPYPKAGDAPVPAPTITSLAPNTAVAGSPSPLMVVVTGTGFTQWSTIDTGGVATPYAQYVSPTKMALLMDPARSTPGIVQVVASDHGVDSAPSDFTYT